MVRQEDRIWMFNERGELVIGRLSPAGVRGDQPRQIDRAHDGAAGAARGRVLVPSGVRQQARVCPQ